MNPLLCGETVLFTLDINMFLNETLIKNLPNSNLTNFYVIYHEVKGGSGVSYQLIKVDKKQIEKAIGFTLNSFFGKDIYFAKREVTIIS
ncbi:hypothetical protein [Photobacterium kishitanii]|uniref:hypothetical protein n=1 Tax=Photobacterium kishitanii TaxID=318456 RepID=UPI0007F8FD73|nr:hypothetical protein [Photobacterium kishitanii]OBU31201.1 hypothetical protein AYY23_20020 [Photobacterium kishitanii]PSW46890.1 hypothetical protein C0W66_21125 [Photobacterium kishitanii]